MKKTNKRKEKQWKLREWQRSRRFGMMRRRPQNQRQKQKKWYPRSSIHG